VKRVAHIITQLEFGGAQQNTLYTVGHLDPERFEPILISGPGGLLDDESRKGSWSTEWVRDLVRPVNPWKDLRALIALYTILRRRRPAIVHTHSSKAGILGRIAAYLAGVPVIVHTFHGFGFTPGQSAWVRRFFILLERLCAHLSTHLVFVSQDNLNEAQSLRIGSGRSRSLIRSGIPIQEPPRKSSIRDDLDIPKSAWVVASVGNFKPQKNPLDLVKTAKAVLESDREVWFLLVGDGELRPSIEAFIQSNEIADRVQLLGWRRDIPAVLAASNCFLLTSLWEGLPRSLLEAAVARLPAVAYAVNGVNDILREGKTGYPVTPLRPDLAAEKILWLKAHPDEAKRIGDRAHVQIGKEFDIDAMVRQQEELYQSLCEAVPLKKYYEPLWS
jgi:glycosyltransferase involved in cell wall biosynthesis